MPAADGRHAHADNIPDHARIATRAGCSEELARSSLKRLRKRLLIEPDGSRPTGWQRTRHGDVVLEHQP